MTRPFPLPLYHNDRTLLSIRSGPPHPPKAPHVIAAISGYEERKVAAEKITKEGEQLRALFQKASTGMSSAHAASHRGGGSSPSSPLDALPLLAEVLKMKDTSLLSLEVSGLIKRYPDISGEHLQSLLLLRGDMARNEARTLVAEMRADDQPLHAGAQRSIFSDIVLT